MTKENKLGARIWLNLIIFGFMGQIAWAVENVYFNTYLFNYIGGDSSDISKMVSLSALTAVLTTFVMGTLSDKLNRRKVFISAGYIAWGLTVAVFAFISRENIGSFFNISQEARVLAATVSIVIIMDCVMTFMGSTSNDAAFNAWLTDVTTTGNRGVAESVLAILPLAATGIVTVAFGAGVSAFGYPACFIALGALVTLCGILGIFTIKDSRSGVKKDSNYLSDIVYGFKPGVVKENKNLYIILLAITIFNCAVQVFMPYIFIYVQHYMKPDLSNLGSMLTPGVIAAAGVAVVALLVGIILIGKGVDKLGRGRFIFVSIIMFTIGLLTVFFADRNLAFFVIGAVVMLMGYGMLMIVLNASVRDFTPEDKVGLFQGVRMIFVVLIPMIIGPAIGSFVTENFSNTTYTNDYNEIVNVPVPEVFLASAIVGVFIIIPAVYLRKKLK